MDRFGLDESLKGEIRERVFGAGFMKLVQSVRRGGSTFRISLRPVSIGGREMYQAESFEGGQTKVKNLDAKAAADGLEEILDQPGARDLHLMTATGDLHVRVTRKGHAMASRSAPMNRDAKVLPHDREKNLPLSRFDSSALLKATGIADASGAVRASMRGKYDQVNEFLKVVGETVPPAGGPGPRAAGGGPFTVVDCRCGKSYLTLSLWYYLTEVMKYPDVKVIGIDRRADVVAASRRTAERLDLAGKVEFVEADLSSLSELPGGGERPRVDMVVSLHACDTATDEALAKGVEWKARYILSAPCCQHELQKSLAARNAFSGLLRQGILRERLCDILTDSFRAMIMRILGFKTQVVEFVSSEATARNIMLRCEYGVKPGQPGPVGEYLELRDYWKVTPWLETRLGERLARHLGRFG